ncbi:hypothetical protein A8708_30180 [Paenibacillus oryzisoli]|uniref:Uncharacterized protein n=1 Tax=Paenibacillus oryzisoli TaxID=1850517 RepID=A0A198AKI8_9BACL|nr:hypothetical protein A8708_30180 [Paenibacillus oryzisoli]
MEVNELKCDYKGCTREATTYGHIFGHELGSSESDKSIPVKACDKHKKKAGFFSDEQIES